MGLRTYEYTFSRNDLEKDIIIKAKMTKKQFNSLVYYLERPFKVESYVLEKNGTIGGEERETIGQILFGKYEMRDKENYQQSINEYVSVFPDVFTIDNYKEAVKLSKETLMKHIFIDDKRLTKSEHEAQEIMRQKFDEKQKEEAIKKDIEREKFKTKFLKEYHYLKKFSDYNKRISDRVLASKNIKIELKRKFPNTTFSVKSDSFSMGNSIDVSYTDGPSDREVRSIIGKYQYGHFNGMIDMYEYSKDLEMNTFRNLFGSSKYVSHHRHISKEGYLKVGELLDIDVKLNEYGHFDQTMNMTTKRKITDFLREYSFEEATKENTIICDDSTILIRHNTEKNGVEISFANKPSQDIIDKLKENGFRWSRFSKVWWKKYSEEAMKKAKEITGE